MGTRVVVAVCTRSLLVTEESRMILRGCPRPAIIPSGGDGETMNALRRTPRDGDRGAHGARGRGTTRTRREPIERGAEDARDRTDRRDVRASSPRLLDRRDVTGREAGELVERASRETREGPGAVESFAERVERSHELATPVVEATGVVKRAMCGDDRKRPCDAPPVTKITPSTGREGDDELGAVLARLDRIGAELKRSGRYRSERAWCEAAGVAPSYVSALRAKHGKGLVTTAKLDALAKLAAAAGVPLGAITGSAAHEEPAPREEIPREVREAFDATDWDALALSLDEAEQLFAEVRAISARKAFPSVRYWESLIRQIANELRGDRRADVVVHPLARPRRK